MKIDELAEDLKIGYTSDRGYGVMKVDGEEYQNIYFVVPPAPPKSLTGEVSYALIGEALKVLGQLPSFDEMSKLDRLINYLFVRREVVQSSRLEGTWSTIEHALTPGEIADSGEGKNEHEAVRNYANVLEDIIEKVLTQKENIFTTAFIQELQLKIVENDPNSRGIPGKFRTHGEVGSIVSIGGLNRIENSIYNPAPASEVERCLEEVLCWFRDEEMAQRGDAGDGLNLPMRLAVGHSHFEAVHPFTDGNGRAGRALWPMQMVCSGYGPLYLSGYVEVKKEDYSEALQQAQKKLNYGPLIEFICHAIIESDLEVKKSREVIRTLEDRWQARGKFRKNSAQQKALALLLTKPIITTSILEKDLNISGTAAKTAIKALEKNNIIRYRKTENRKRIYAAEELISILSRPFGSDIELALDKAYRLLTNDSDEQN
jgi:Fic family protein